MAISEDTKAIISQLEMQGELIRNTGANSLREVNVKLDKFSDAFVSIAANISSNNQMLQNSQKMMREQAEYDRQQRDFDDLKRDKEVKVKEKSDLGVKEGLKDIKDSLSGFSMTGLLGGIGKAIGIGLGAAVAGNILKGFVDEKYDGAFTNFQNNLANLDFGLINQSIKDMQLATEKLVTQMEQINETVKKITDSLLFKLATTVGILTTIQQTFKRIIGPYFADVFDARRVKRRQQMDMFRNADKLSMENLEEFNKTRNRPPLGTDFMPENLTSPELDGTSSGGKGLIGGSNAIDTNNPNRIIPPNGPNAFNAPNDIYEPVRDRGGRAFGSFGASGQGNFITRGKGNQALVDSSMGPNGERGVGRSPGAQAGFKKPKGAFMSQAELDLAFKELGQLKLFKEVVKGLVFVGIAWTIYDSINLYYAWKATPEGPAGDEARKMILINEFGSLVTGAGGAAVGAFIGTFGGPWGILLFSVIGGVAGSLAGPTIVGMIYDWANEKPLTEQQAEQAIAAIDGKIETLTANMNNAMTSGSPFAGAAAMGAQEGIRALVDERNVLSARVASIRRARGPAVREGMNYLQSGMEAAAYGSGGRRMFEISRSGTPQQKAVLLDALLEVESIYQKGMTDIEAFLSQGAAPTIINAPTNVNPVITNTHGGNSKSEVNVVGGGFAGDTFVNGLPYLAQ